MKAKLLNPEAWRRIPLYLRVYILFLIWRDIHAGLFSLPMSLSIRASLLTFIILVEMPFHPMSPVIASGGGLSLALLMWRIK